MVTKRRLAWLAAAATIAATSSVVAWSATDEPATAEQTYLDAVRSDDRLDGWSDADLVTLGHETCANLDETAGQFDAMFFAMSVDHPDRPELLDSAGTVIVAAATLCPAWSTAVDGIAADMGF
jgi:hypothetical protein